MDAPHVKLSLSGRLLIFLAVGIILLVIVSPLVQVFWGALREGVPAYLSALVEAESMAALRLTAFVVAIAVPVNLVFGVAFAWLVTRFRFRGRGLLLVLVDVPLSVSPVIAGLMFVLLFGVRSPLGGWLAEHGLKIIFATPGIILTTIFVTLPYVARILIPFMEESGTIYEEAALTLGASGWQLFCRVTLPTIIVPLGYGAVLCNARALGEFGAVSVVSGHIRGVTNTLPLEIEILYNEFHFGPAFALSTLLTSVALLTIVLQHALSRRFNYRGRLS